MARRSKPKMALRAYRKKNNLTAEQAGAMIHVAASTWRSYENGSREVDGDTAVLIEKRCGVDRILIRSDLFRRAA
jgi:transcriptional regulator with XRE-family HTH domain